MHSTNYVDTFISISDDCPVTHSEIPPSKNPQTAAEIQFTLIINSPYILDSDDVLFASHGERRGLSRAEFFTKGQACFRASPLTKRYGWGVHSNSEGRIAIYPMESADYRKFSSDSHLKQLKAMRSSRK
ncbi:MAG: DUF6157 family protein [Mycobacteriaceae bacterium]